MNEETVNHDHEEPLNEEHKSEKKAAQDPQIKENLKDIATGVSGLAKTGAKEGSKPFKKGLIGGKNLLKKAKEQAKEAKIKSDLKKDKEGSSVIVDAEVEEKKEH